MKHDLFTFHAWMGERWGWWSAIPITLFWVFLWPLGLLGLLWLVISPTGRHYTWSGEPAKSAAKPHGAHSQTESTSAGTLYWALCGFPLVAQGLVPILLKLLDTDVKALFIAFYLPEAYQWPFMLGMVTLGAVLLSLAIKSTYGSKHR